MIFALIPAAGKSTRMGRPKLSLPLGDKTVIEHVVGALRRAGIENVLVVIGPHDPELLPLVQRTGSDHLVLDDETPYMRATVERGLAFLESRYHPTPNDMWLLIPADHPTLSATIVRDLLAAATSKPACSIVVPTFEGKRGHPTLIVWSHLERLRDYPKNLGLNTYLRSCADETLELPVSDSTVLTDLDTPEDLQRLQELFMK